MKKLPLILAILLGVLDAALAVGIVLLLVTPGNMGKSGSDGESLVAEDFEDQSEDYGKAAKSASYSAIIRANAGTGPGQSGSAQNEPTPTLGAASSGSATPGGAETVPGMPDSDFIFPYSSTRLITEAEMNQKLTSKELAQRAINEIYARHGYQFHQDKNAENYAYFNSKSWYRSLKKIDSQEEVRKLFSDVETANTDALIAYQNNHNWN